MVVQHRQRGHMSFALTNGVANFMIYMRREMLDSSLRRDKSSLDTIKCNFFSRKYERRDLDVTNIRLDS
ncbi:hypothetical protein BLOT_007735 [Blomia tropicalis]|nr:hypothetical protein BLOT_007735 [Blomia tropicalis]